MARNHDERRDDEDDHERLGVEPVTDQRQEREESRDCVRDEGAGLALPLAGPSFDRHGLRAHDGGGTRRSAAASISAARSSIGVHLSIARKPVQPSFSPFAASRTTAGEATDAWSAAIARPASTRDPSNSTRTTSER